MEKKHENTVPEKTFCIIGGITGVGKNTEPSVNYLGRIIDPDPPLTTLTLEYRFYNAIRDIAERVHIR